MKTFLVTLLPCILAPLQLLAQLPPMYNPADVTYGIQSGNTYDITTRDGREHYGIIYNNVDKDGYGTITTFSPDMSTMTTTHVSPGFSVTTSLGQ